ncbi:MAG: hypothetical protein R6U68_05890 [Desulfobacteraceae bacterium]
MKHVSKTKKYSACLVFLLAVFAFTGCDKGENGDYSGVGKLVAERNRARMSRAENQDNRNEREKPSSSYGTASPKKERERDLVFEEEVTITAVSSGRTIARGTAYLDKNGKIINIRIKRD